jgi:hypothetical protein
MKNSAFDCALNYHDNKLNPINQEIVCLDYTTKSRDDYLYAPGIEDTVENIELAQEKVISIPYKTFEYKGTKFFHAIEPNSDGKIFIYDQSIVGRIRLPKPVGELRVINGALKKVFYARKNKKQ